jgi:adenosylmethionine-8-amino-7-oxononanoate aminotransferase
VNLGHGLAEIGEAMAEQAKRIAYVSGLTFTNSPVESLAAEIARRSAPGVDKVYFLSSGSEAVEAALKLARQYWVEAGRPTKHKIIALAPSYHGNTLLALSASAREHYRALYHEWLVDVVRIPAPYAYRCACRGKDPRCPVCSGAALEEAILREGPGAIAAFIAEPVGGSSTGGSVPRPDYFRRIREICDRYEVLFIADEILCGVGRTGTWSALEPYGVAPDIQTMGKGIAGGYVPLSAVAVSRKIVDTIAAGSGAFVHAQTFSHHAVLCSAGLATLNYLDRHQLIERGAMMGRELHARLQPLLDLPHVGDVRGRGLLAGIEFVEDKATRAPFPRSLKFAERLTEAALDAGLTVFPNAGSADGTNGDLVMLAPPFVVSEEQIGEMVSALRTAIERTSAGIMSVK